MLDVTVRDDGSVVIHADAVTAAVLAGRDRKLWRHSLALEPTQNMLQAKIADAWCAAGCPPDAADAKVSPGERAVRALARFGEALRGTQQLGAKHPSEHSESGVSAAMFSGLTEADPDEAQRLLFGTDTVDGKHSDEAIQIISTYGLNARRIAEAWAFERRGAKVAP